MALINVFQDSFYCGTLANQTYLRYVYFNTVINIVSIHYKQWLYKVIFAVPGFWVLEYQLVTEMYDAKKGGQVTNSKKILRSTLLCSYH